MLKRLTALLLILCLQMLPTEALAAKVSIKFPGKVGMLYVGQTVAVRPALDNVSLGSLSWKSSDTDVLRTDGNRLTGVSEGLAAVRASYGSAKATCGVVVLPRTIELEVGETYALPFHSILKYASRDKSVAKINSKGVVTAADEGTTLVGVKHGSVMLTVEVTVNAPDAPAAPEQSKAAELDCAKETDQIVLVEYQGNAKATVSFHEKVNGLWTQVGSTSGYVGKNGIGKTREGDKKTPSGTYNLTMPFGIKSDPGANMPYTKVTKYHYWCGTSGSEYYNQLVDARKVSRSAKSTDEKLINYTGYYNYCLFIDYNADGEANRGSCIFLHCTGSKKDTSGCIAIPESAMKQCVKWVREGAKIVIR